MTSLISSSRTLLSKTVESPLGRLTIAGTLQKGAGATWKTPRVLGSYALVYIVAGSGFYNDVRGIRSIIKAGDLILIFPEIGHNYGPGDSERWDEIYLVFDGVLFDLLRQQQVFNPARPVLHLEPIEFWLRQIEAVAETGEHNKAFRPLQVIASLHTLLINIAVAQLQTELPEWVQVVCQKLDDPKKIPDWPQLARRSQLSYNVFRKQFTKLVGMAPAQYRMARLIDRAGVLLQETDLPQREIAEQLGFSDEYHFSKAFKRRLGFPPSVFRQQVRPTGRTK